MKRGLNHNIQCIMQNYCQLLSEIVQHGTMRDDRTGTGTRALFGRQLRYNLNDGFPLMTTKKLHIPSIVHELLWFLRGEPHIQYLRDHKITIWDEWADENGQLGPVYGVQWRAWRGYNGEHIDQIAQLIHNIKTNPHSRRLIVSAWNVGEIDAMALPPCHAFMQFFVANNQLSCQLYQRSADIFLGVPFNIASYSLLTHLIAKVCQLGVGELIMTFGDVHLYENHHQQAQLQLSREYMPLCQLQLNNAINDIDKFTHNDIIFANYHAHPTIKAPIAV